MVAIAAVPMDSVTPGQLDQRVVEVPLTAVRPGDSPRIAGSSTMHARLLAQSDASLPPILVHRPTMQVIDGTHRLDAARLRGDRMIRVRFFDGAREDAFVLAVEANVTHGLPLSLADRKAAALRIIRTHPVWSDRAIAAKTGLAHKTVGAIRRSSGDVLRSTARLGMDGRVREVKDGRNRERDPGAEPADETSPTGTQQEEPYSASRAEEWRSNLQRLRADPSLRYTHVGRSVLRCLNMHAATLGRWDGEIIDLIPEHCLAVLIDIATTAAADWGRLAELLHERTRDV
jgi:hypothetical protein